MNNYQMKRRGEVEERKVGAFAEKVNKFINLRNRGLSKAVDAVKLLLVGRDADFAIFRGYND